MRIATDVMAVYLAQPGRVMTLGGLAPPCRGSRLGGGAPQEREVLGRIPEDLDRGLPELDRFGVRAGFVAAGPERTRAALVRHHAIVPGGQLPAEVAGFR
jgi:hypothetical protein